MEIVTTVGRDETDALIHLLEEKGYIRKEGIQDALGILAVQGTQSDLLYVMKWAQRLKIDGKVRTLLADKILPNMERLP